MLPVKKMLGILLMSGVISLLAGCATPLVDYKQPSGPQTAKLLMRGMINEGETYGVYLFDDPEACRGMQKVAVGSSANDPAAVTIGASGLATMDVFFTRIGRSYCRVRWSFYPKAGKTYLVRAQFQGDRCRAMIMDASDPEKIVIEPTLVRRDIGGNWCVPMSQTRPVKTDAQRDEGEGSFSLPIPGNGTAPKTGGSRMQEKVSDDDLKGLIGGK